MFKTLKMYAIRLMRNYHHNMVDYYDRKRIERESAGYSGLYYEHKSWKHVDKELKLNRILLGLDLV